MRYNSRKLNTKDRFDMVLGNMVGRLMYKDLTSNMEQDLELENTSNFLFYSGDDGSIKVQIILGDETVWTSQKGMAEIFGTTKQNISLHLTNIFGTNELGEDSVVKEILTTAQDNKKYSTKFYNLDVIIAVGYRVNSYSATQFRRWATKILKEYLVKGFAIDSERLKQGNHLFGKDFFEELLEKIREIRASERRLYQKVTDIYQTCSIDYDPNSPITQTFFKTVQNKLEFAITHHTAAEIIKLRANASMPNMGLTSWKNEKKGGKILKTDVCIAKNYLKQDEIKELNRLVNQYLEYAEGMAVRRKTMTMKEWAEKLDAFLTFNEYDVLKNAGNISHDIAKKLAEKEYAKFRVIQDKEYESDFDKVVEDFTATHKLPKESDFINNTDVPRTLSIAEIVEEAETETPVVPKPKVSESLTDNLDKIMKAGSFTLPKIPVKPKKSEPPQE